MFPNQQCLHIIVQKPNKLFAHQALSYVQEQALATLKAEMRVADWKARRSYMELQEMAHELQNQANAMSKQLVEVKASQTAAAQVCCHSHPHNSTPSVCPKEQQPHCLHCDVNFVFSCQICVKLRVICFIGIPLLLAVSSVFTCLRRPLHCMLRLTGGPRQSCMALVGAVLLSGCRIMLRASQFVLRFV